MTRGCRAHSEYLQERWCDVQEGTLSLPTVALITNTALELLQLSEQELLLQLPPRERKLGYEGMTDMLFYDAGLAHVDYDKLEKDAQMGTVDMNEAISEEADWLCLPRYWHLVKWLEFAPPGKVPTNPQFIGVPIDFRTEGVKAKAARDRRVCDELLMECCLLKPLMKRSDFSIPGLDELTRGVVTMLQTRKIPIWLIFACQIQCGYSCITSSSRATVRLVVEASSRFYENRVLWS